MKAETKNMLIIKDAHGEIIGAQIESPADSEIRAHILPADPQHTLHRVWDVPAQIYKNAQPDSFRSAIAKHMESAQARVTQIQTKDLAGAFSGLRAAAENTSRRDLERENERLKKAVTELTLEKLALKEELAGRS